ncbi:MAG: polyprenol phosphomannose-dependent alpha 1,6 mannosyltransferase MptB [Cellulomonas sp.]|nr:polyprenol phosphomannose-dependent alpha 1,6 mannosyltransferase MptB [Actinomycetota bacterium]MCG2798982.1 polyprenol phosphomannose-dependent alpha 1,6 mannosyltransferase MptB [Cellulomonas sp.]
MDGTLALGADRPALVERPLVRVATVAGAGAAVVTATAVAASYGGFTQNVLLPSTWGPWPTGSAASAGWLAVELLLVGLLCMLWFTVSRYCFALPFAARPKVAVLGAVAAAWSFPLLLTGPMGSLDVFSYAAVGRLADLGLNPYHIGPGILGDGYAAAVSPMWRTTPTPYGPVQVEVLRLLASVAGPDVGTAVFLVRLLAVAGLVGAVLVTVRAALPEDQAVAVMLTALNPVVLVTVVSGSHLDVIVGGLAVLVVLLVRRGRTSWAMAAAVLACFVKLPGAVLVGYVLLAALRRTAPTERRRMLMGALATGAGATLAAWALLPDAFGWVGALGVPGTTRGGMAPSTWLSWLIALVTGNITEPGLSTAFTIGRTVTAVAGALGAAALLFRATGRATDRDAYASVGWALVVVALSAPSTFPWYLTWGLFAIAVGGGRRSRTAISVLSAGFCVVGVFSGSIASAVALVAVGALAGTLAWRQRHGELSPAIG